MVDEDADFDTACILCAIDKEDPTRDELAATYYAVGLATGYRPHGAPAPCDRHMASIAIGATLLGKVCAIPPEEIEEYERAARERARRMGGLQ